MVATLSGSKLRARRLALGLRQGEVAQGADISASYLNLIEHNRRRVPDDVLARLAQVLGQTPQDFADGGGGALQDDLRAVALAWPSAELARVEEFAQRFPGWADAVLAMHQRNLALDGAIAAVNDRMSHDPHLSASLHEVLSAVASVRATSEILAATEDLEPEWQARFLRNLDQDSQRLAQGADALVRYLDTGGQIEAQGTATPQEEVEAWAAAQDWQIAHSQLDHPGPEGAGAQMMSRAARSMAADLQAQLRADQNALPETAFRAALARHGPDPLAIAADCAAPPFAAFRRIAFDGGLGAGLVVCDGSGTLVLRRPVAGFSLPRFGAACPLWPLFTALGRPAQPIEVTAVMGPPSPMTPRFLLRAFASASYPLGFGGPELRCAMMLILPMPDTAASVPIGTAANHAGAAPAPPLALGSTCRICTRENCPARREPSILMAASPDFAAPFARPRGTGL